MSFYLLLIPCLELKKDVIFFPCKSVIFIQNMDKDALLDLLCKKQKPFNMNIDAFSKANKAHNVRVAMGGPQLFSAGRKEHCKKISKNSKKYLNFSRFYDII